MFTRSAHMRGGYNDGRRVLFVTKYTKLEYFVHIRLTYHPKFECYYSQTPYMNKHMSVELTTVIKYN